MYILANVQSCITYAFLYENLLGDMYVECLFPFQIAQAFPGIRAFNYCLNPGDDFQYFLEGTFLSETKQFDRQNKTYFSGVSRPVDNKTLF